MNTTSTPASPPDLLARAESFIQPLFHSRWNDAPQVLCDLRDEVIRLRDLNSRSEAEVAAFVKALAALSVEGVLPANFNVQAFATAELFVQAFKTIYKSVQPSGNSVALITDRKDPALAQIGARRKFLSVVGDADPLKQTASTLLAADLLLGSLEGISPFTAIAALDKEGRLGDLMANITSYIATQAKVLASA